MNIKAINEMEQFARKVLKLPCDRQDDLFRALDQTIGKEDTDVLRRYVSIHSIMTNKAKYDAVRDALMEQFLREVME